MSPSLVAGGEGGLRPRQRANNVLSCLGPAHPKASCELATSGVRLRTQTATGHGQRAVDDPVSQGNVHPWTLTSQVSVSSRVIRADMVSRTETCP